MKKKEERGNKCTISEERDDDMLEWLKEKERTSTSGERAKTVSGHKENAGS